MRNTTKHPGAANPDPDTYVSINEVCRQFGFSRQTFYRMLADPDGGLGELVLRIPPRTGRIRVPVRRFEAWLLGRREGEGPRGISPETLGES